MSQQRILVGVISDTHGLLRPEALEALLGVDLIIHAGDVDKADILELLGQIAPVVAVRGNVDTGAWAQSIPISEVVGIVDRRIFTAPIRPRVMMRGNENQRRGVYGHRPGGVARS